MPRITPRFVNMLCLGLLSSLPLFSVADDQLHDSYLTSKPLALEIRYCDCAAMGADGASPDVLPGFLKESERLRVGISSKDKGFVSSEDFMIGYEIEPARDRPGSFVLDYASAYTDGASEHASQGKLLLATGEWLPLSGSYHETESGDQEAFGVAIRLIKSP